MTTQSTSALPGLFIAVLALCLVGCAPRAQPEEGPEAVARRFYELIAAAKSEGGTTPASEAYKRCV